MEKQEIQRKTEYFEDLDIMDFVPEQYQENTGEENGNRIEVEEIDIGE